MQLNRNRSNTRLLIGLLAAFGCGDTSDTLAGNASGGDSNGSSNTNGHSNSGASDGREQFVLVQRVIAEDDRQQYVHVLDGLPSGKLDSGRALEITGYAQFNYYQGFLYVSNGDDMTLTRYAISKEGKVEAQGVLSFIDFGLTWSPVPEFIENEAWIWNGPEVIIVDLEKFEVATPDPVDFAGIYAGIPENLVPSANATGAAFQQVSRVREGKL